MAQSRMTAKNTFGEGLIMDFAPDNTQAETLTNALNATLLTYNGNEMSLLNDMGNGRVETAFLPEGYIPMGTCEFGGIIYVVSYNPQNDKCQIGSFPSPERNITKDDKLDTDLNTPSITSAHFQEGEGSGTSFIPNGTIKSLVSKVVIREDSLNPGDKYIIECSSRESGYTNFDAECLSELANDDKAKRVKLSIVSIEDSGKITKLTTQDYIVNVNGNSKNFKIPTAGTIKSIDNTDIDSYRKLVSLNYNVFSSRIPGKLAILAELEVISSFSCAHRVVTSTTKISGEEYTNYDMYIDYKWEAEDDTIFPKYITMTDFSWESKLKSENYGTYGDKTLTVSSLELVGSDLELSEISGYTIPVNLPKLVDDSSKSSYFVHEVTSTNHALKTSTYSYIGSRYLDKTRYYSFDVTDESGKVTRVSIAGAKNNSSEDKTERKISEVEFNNKLSLSNTVFVCRITVPSKFYGYSFRLPFKLHYEITPAMDFGLLDHLAVDNEIDFSLIGTKLIQPTGLKYFVSSDILTLNIDSEIYEEENHKVTGMALEFYDANGFCGSYLYNDRESYAGNIVSNFPLNSLYFNTNKYGSTETWYHNIREDLAGTGAYYPSTDTGDCGILYSNLLYGVKLKYIYSELDPITLEVTIADPEIIPKDFWLYTNGQFNNYYYLIDDYSQIKFLLPLIYSFKMYDNTSKYDIKFETSSLKFLQNLMNASYENINNWNEDKKQITTLASYKGTFDLSVIVGLELNPVFSLITIKDESLKPELQLNLLSPYSDEDGTFVVIEEESSENTSSEDEEALVDSSTKKYTDYDSSAKLEFKTESSGKVNSEYTFNTSIELDLPKVKFITTPSEYKKSIITSTILTPILYKENKDDDYNYEDVGGETLFGSALCYVGSDDPTSEDSLTTSADDSWYETRIDTDGATSDVLLYEYDSGIVHTNLVGGVEALTLYYDSLGNRQPFTLFTILKPEPTSEGGYDTKWTHNIAGPGEVYTTSSNNDYKNKNCPFNHNVILLLNGCTYHYSPDWQDRAYLPAFITNRIAAGGYEVAMSSSGGGSGVLFDRKYINYTSQTATKIKNGFYKSYLTTLKELITVNPDLKTCEVGTFEYNEDSCKNLLLISVVTSKLTNGEAFKNLAKKMVAIHGVPFTTYTKYLLDRMYDDSEDALLTENDSNINMEFDVSQLGDNEKSVLTYINYTMLHEHSLIEDYLNYLDKGIIKYINLSWNEKTSKYEEGWSSNMVKADIDINESCFYKVYSDKNGILYLEKVTNKFKADSDGHLTELIIDPQSLSRSSLLYKPGGYPIFYNTTMTIDDFIWDTDNKKHHFIFNKESNLRIVDPAYAYLLDDDYGGDNDILSIRSYYIGPSFNSQF